MWNHYLELGDRGSSSERNGIDIQMDLPEFRNQAIEKPRSLLDHVKFTIMLFQSRSRNLTGILNTK